MVDFSTSFNNASASLSTEADNIMNKMDTLIASEDGISQEDLLTIQFEMGQYNAKLEALSTMTKSIQDMLKTLAQRTG